MNATSATTAVFTASALREEGSVRPKLLTEIFSTVFAGQTNLVTASSVTGLLKTLHHYKLRAALKNEGKDHAAIVTDKVWEKFLNSLVKDYAETHPSIVPSVELLQADCIAGNLPDVTAVSIYTQLGKSLAGTDKALRAELKYVAHFRGVSIEEAEAKFVELRDSFESDVNKADHIANISKWVGEGANRMKGFKFFYVPDSDDVLYAIYRMRTDDTVFPADTRNIVSVDIETAGPKGRDGFVPKNGRIIEVGMVEYTPQGEEVDRWEILIRPEDEFLAEFGTGAIEVHQIAVSDLDGKQSWEQVQAEVYKRLTGRKLLAQNAKFERSWFHEWLEGFTELNMDTVDTMEIAEKLLPETENNQLSTICGAVGVAYTNGHRALHDALVTGEAYFAILRKAATVWK